jgi:hypothetical protein
MEITEVKFEKLFSLERYNNEKIGLTASISKGDNANQVMSEIILRVLAVEDCLKLYRAICDSETRYTYEVARLEKVVLETRGEIGQMKASIDSLAKQAEGGDVDAKLKHACSGRSYKALQEDLLRQDEELLQKRGQLAKATGAREEMKQRIKQGKFVDKDLDLPKLYTEQQY